MLTATVLTKNSERLLRETLDSLIWVDEVIVLDNGSTDGTLAIASRYPNVRMYETEFCGFGPLHNKATELASHDWILSVDSDEVITPELAKEIQELALDPHSIYSIQRQNEFNGRWVKGCGWHPDRVLRLYNRTATHFSDDAVHERLLSEGLRVVELKARMRHYSYTCIADLLQKMQFYSDLFAKQKRGKKSSSLLRAVVGGWYTFFFSYFVQRGIFCGYEGFVISAFRAHTVFYKYLKLKEENDRWKSNP
jgi:glycosyltransferase involved in cell wall biosynthesis